MRISRIAAAALVPIACAQSHVALPGIALRTHSALVGCWEITTDHEPTRLLRSPAHLGLDSIGRQVDSVPPRYDLTLGPGLPDRTRAFGSWHPYPDSDSGAVSWGDGFEGLTLRLLAIT